MCTTNDQNSTLASTTYNPNDWLYIPSFNANTDHRDAPRYVLGTRGQNPLIFICKNPSTAIPDDLDRTLNVISNYIGNQTTYDSWIVLNLYPDRATDPQDLPKEMDNRLHQANLAAIEFVLSQFDHPHICVAWGDIKDRNYFIQCIRDIIDRAKAFKPTYFCIEETQAGHPHHPLRTHIELKPFDMDEYRTTVLQGLEQRLQR